jgi:hypothetical protein
MLHDSEKLCLATAGFYALRLERVRLESVRIGIQTEAIELDQRLLKYNRERVAVDEKINELLANITELLKGMVDHG